MVPASQAARNMILEATALGATSYILIGFESTPSCLDDMIHGTGGAYIGQQQTRGNRDATAAEVSEAGATVSALVESSSGG